MVGERGGREGGNTQEAEAMEIVFLELYLQPWGRAPSPLAKRPWEHGNMGLKEEPHREPHRCKGHKDPGECRQCAKKPSICTKKR